MTALLLIGGGSHCQACIDVIEQQNRYSIAGIIDMPERVGEFVLNYPVIGSDDDLPRLVHNWPNAIITLGEIGIAEKRKSLYHRLKSLSYRLPAIISPLAYVAPSASLGEGTIVMHHALVNASASVGDNVVVNSKALIEHNALVGNHCHVATSATINGGASLGEGSFIGSNAATVQNIQIPPYTFIKAGQVIKESGHATHIYHR